MGTTLALQSATVVGFANHPTLPRIIVFSTQGVDVYRASDMQRVAWAAIGNVTCGAANNNGIYVGTSDAGIYRLPLTMQDCAMGAMTRVFGAGAAVELASYDIKDLSGHGSALAIVTAAEMVYLPSPASAHTYTGSGTPLRCAINGSYLAWGTATGVEIAALPTGDWSSSDASTPDAANRLTFEAGTDNLLICHSDGLRLVDCTDAASAGGLPTDGLVAHWTFDAVNSTTVYDECGNHNGTLVGSATAGSRDGQIGKALNCDGIDGGMTFGALGIFGSNFTVTMWAEFDRAAESMPNHEYLFYPRAEKDISLYREKSTGKICFEGYNVSAFRATSITAPATGAPVFIVGRWTMGAKLELFVNGVLESTLESTKTPSTTSDISAFGYQTTATPVKWLDGAIDECRVYNRLLTDNDIAALYRQTDPVAPRAGLVSHYTMDAIAGTTLYDEIGTANGTISGATQVDGYLGKALSFDGINDYVDLNYGAGATFSEATIVAWVKIAAADKPAAGSTATICNNYELTNGKHLGLRVYDTGKVGFFVDDDVNAMWNERSNEDVCDGEWHMVAGVFKATTQLRIQIDNNAPYTQNTVPTGAISSCQRDFFIGYETASSTEYLKGHVENVRIYNRALSAEELSGLYAEAWPSMPRNGLIAHWSMGSINGTTLVEEGGSYNGTIAGATQVDGHIGKALSFDGTNDFVEIPHNSALKPTAAITYMAWGYRDDWSSAGNTRLLSCTEAGGFNFEFDNVTTGNVDASIRISGTYQHAAFTYTGLNPGWHFFAATCDGRYTKIYVDGVLHATDDRGSTGTIDYTNNNSIIIGGEAGSGTGCSGSYWAGLIDSVRIYCRALSAAEIAILYTEGLGGYGTNYDSDLGTATDCQDAWKAGAYIAYGTRNGSDGGRFGILQLDEDHNATSKTTVASTDTDAVWLAAGATEAIYNNIHERYRMVVQISPGANAIAVRRDWTLYAEITDALGGIQAGTVALTINGQAVTPTTSAITNGYAVAYTPGSSSGYAERVAIELSGTDANGNTVSRAWSFVTAPAPGATVTDSTPPNVVCTRDIGLSTAEADEQVGGVNVIWLEDIAGPLFVTDAQAVAVGTLAIDEVTYHRHIRTMTVMPADANGLPTRDLRAGQVVTMTCPAIGMTAQKCEVLAIQRKIDDQDDITFTLQIAYYEAVT